MKKRMTIMLLFLGILFTLIFGLHFFKAYMIKRYLAANQSPTITVSTMKVAYSDWQPQIKASGSLRAIRGVDVTTELAGMVKTIYFTPGATVDQGTLLVQLNIDADVAQLHSLQANENLAAVTYKRDSAQFAIHAISKATLDTDIANLKSLQAQVAQQQATILKKTITAPFSGHLGISNVNPGQYVNPGDKVVTLETLNPLYVDFFVPQQQLGQLAIGLPIAANAEAYSGKVYLGKITTIEPAVDTHTRNVEVEATIVNPLSELKPGMFATVTVSTGKPQRFLTLPQTAISFNPYGEIVYVVKQDGKDSKGKTILTAQQRFVTTGEVRGDQVTILSGLKEGDVIVSSGQLKLKNGSRIEINNSIVPENQAAPNAPNEY